MIDHEREDALHDLEDKARQHAKEADRAPQVPGKDHLKEEPKGDHAVAVVLAR